MKRVGENNVAEQVVPRSVVNVQGGIHLKIAGHVLITCVSLTSRSLGILQNESFVAFRLFLNLENQPSRRLRPRALRKSRQEFARD